MRKGFTLIEILVVMSIISVLGAFMFANYRAGQEQLAFQRSVHKLAQDIRRVQEMAMSAEEIGQSGVKFYPEGGFGIHFEISEPGQYILFADCEDDGEYWPGDRCGPPGKKFPELIEMISLESKVRITGLSTNFSSSLPSLDTTFSAPDPTVFITDGAAEAKITISLDASQTAAVTVNSLGLIAIIK